MEAILYVVNTMAILVVSIVILFVTKEEETEVLEAHGVEGEEIVI